jgi:hypothetical protein
VVYSGGRNAGNLSLGAQWYIVDGGMQVIKALEHTGTVYSGVEGGMQVI